MTLGQRPLQSVPLRSPDSPSVSGTGCSAPAQRRHRLEVPELQPGSSGRLTLPPAGMMLEQHERGDGGKGSPLLGHKQPFQTPRGLEVALNLLSCGYCLPETASTPSSSRKALPDCWGSSE